MGIIWRILLLKLLDLSGTVYMFIYIITGVFGSYLISRLIVRRIPLFRMLFLGMPYSNKRSEVSAKK